MNLKQTVLYIKDNKKWKSYSRIIGEACEEYVKNNITCIRCNGCLEKYKINEKSKK